MALTAQGSIEPPPDPRATADAAVNAFDATRMHREAGTAAVASQHTSSNSGESGIADGSFELGAAKTLGGVMNVGAPGSPGFPGLVGNSYPDGTPPAA
jgi:hypothetical protein